MKWESAKEVIEDKIRVGVKLTPTRKVTAVNTSLKSDRYGYKNECGFRVSISSGTSIAIPWSMLDSCYKALGTATGYSNEKFKRLYPIQIGDHGCYVHVVGQIFLHADLATQEGRVYRLSKAGGEQIL